MLVLASLWAGYNKIVYPLDSVSLDRCYLLKKNNKYNKKGTAQGRVSYKSSHHGILLTEIKRDVPQSFRMIQQGRWTCYPEAPSSCLP